MNSLELKNEQSCITIIKFEINDTNQQNLKMSLTSIVMVTSFTYWSHILTQLGVNEEAKMTIDVRQLKSKKSIDVNLYHLTSTDA